MHDDLEGRFVMRSEKRNLRLLVPYLLLTLCLAQFSCNKPDAAQPSSGESVAAHKLDPHPIEAADLQNFKSMLDAAASGVGQVGDIKGASASRRLAVFEEKHTSVASQFEIALMLLRLHERHGLRDIVLEGLTDDKKFPDTQWFRNLGGPEDEEVRNEVLVGMLRDGEISAVELIATAFPDVMVHSGDDAASYRVELTKSGRVVYLFKIGLKSAGPEHYARINQLNAQHDLSQLLEYVVSLDPWAKERYAHLKDSADCIEDSLRSLREIEEKAEAVGAEITAEERNALAEERTFFEAADKRSHTMSNLAIGFEPKSPLVAFNIGAAHTCGVKKLIESSGATYAVITPLSHKKEAGDLSYDSFERKHQLRSVAWTGKGLGSLLDGRKKPPPDVGETWTKADSQIRVAVILIVRAIRDKGAIDANLKRRIDSFDQLRVDWPSVAGDAGEVTFNTSVKLDKGWTPIAVRAGTPKSFSAAKNARLKLEDMLLRDLTLVRNEPGERKEPTKTPVVELIAPDVVASFATSSESLKHIRVTI
jgi:hypothetical protein